MDINTSSLYIHKETKRVAFVSGFYYDLSTTRHSVTFKYVDTNQVYGMSVETFKATFDKYPTHLIQELGSK